MPRKSISSVCKVCGANATVKSYSSKGSNGKSYFYERFRHTNGVVHYFRIGRRTSRTDISDTFAQMIETRISERNYRFREIKLLFESVYGSTTNNTTVSRNIERAIKSNLLEKKVRKNETAYTKKDRSDIINETKISDASLTYRMSDGKVSLTLFIHLENKSDKLLTSIPVALPSGTTDSVSELKLRLFDQIGEIPHHRIRTIYSYPGQVGILMDFNRPIRSGERNFIFLEGEFEIRDEFVKFALPLNTDSFRINFTSNNSKEVLIRKRLLDGIKETGPEFIRRGIMEGGGMYTDVEFDNALKGEAIVVSWKTG